MEGLFKNVKRGDRFVTRSHEIVTFIEHYHVNNHKLIERSNGDQYLVTQFGIAMHFDNDVMYKL